MEDTIHKRLRKLAILLETCQDELATLTNELSDVSIAKNQPSSLTQQFMAARRTLLLIRVRSEIPTNSTVYPKSPRSQGWKEAYPTHPCCASSRQSYPFLHHGQGAPAPDWAKKEANGMNEAPARGESSTVRVSRRAEGIPRGNH